LEIRIDENGKFFTPHVSKEPVPVVVHTADQLIVGSVHLRMEQRLKDELNSSGERFLAITDARVYTKGAEKLLYTSTLVLVSHAHVVAVSPLDAFGAAEGVVAHELLKEAR
jgi:hypothetical protein